jgi:hypothetical protein
MLKLKVKKKVHTRKHVRHCNPNLFLPSLSVFCSFRVPWVSCRNFERTDNRLFFSLRSFYLCFCFLFFFGFLLPLLPFYFEVPPHCGRLCRTHAWCSVFGRKVLWCGISLSPCLLSLFSSRPPICLGLMSSFSPFAAFFFFFDTDGKRLHFSNRFFFSCCVVFLPDIGTLF